MTAAILILVASCLPACHAITAAHDAGARCWLAYVVWLLEELAERLLRAARWLRDFHAWREARKAVSLETRSAGNWSPSASGYSPLNSGAAMESATIAAVPVGQS